MTSIKKWLPFLFKREDKSAETRDPETKNMGSKPVRRNADPAFQMMEDMLRGFALRDPLSVFGLSPLGDTHADGRSSWFGDFRPAVFSPTIDVVDDGDAVRIAAELPGTDEANVDVAVNDGALVIRGQKSLEKEKEEAGCYRLERSFGAFFRSIPLPGDMDPDRAKATFKDGVLTVRIPKNENAADTTKRIPISAS